MVDEAFYTATGELSENSARDLEVFTSFWPALLRMEIEEVYGPVDGDIRLVEKQGTCVSEAELAHKDDGNIEVFLKDERGLGITAGAYVLISATHPTVDMLGRCAVRSRESLGRLDGYRLTLGDDGSAKIAGSTWRLDLEANYVPFYRLSGAVRTFGTIDERGSCRAAVKLLVATHVGQASQRRELNKSPNAAEALRGLKQQPGLEGLNRSQVEAIEEALTHRLQCIQGPPGTGKPLCLQRWSPSRGV